MRDQQGAPLAEKLDEYRLPKTVIPSRYEIRLEPDLESSTFKGEERIAVSVKSATAEVVLNALELEIASATAERAGRSLGATVELEPARERAHLKFPQPLDDGEWTLKIAFSGILNDKLHGFYRSQYQDQQGRTHRLATTQMESTDARRAFPCWDEPELKACFKVALVIDESLTAVSNSAQESERRLAGGKKEVVFRETIPMSTYLVAFIVGPFEATEPADAGTPLRVVHVAGKSGLAPFARQIGVFSLKFFASYYGLKYPGDKLDLIAIPDFAAGAMENLGAVTFRETALLADDKTASRQELERIADVVAHELAHMWFGDLVTMRWWNGIWLNEAFATFMEMLAVDAWKPEWKRWDSFSVGRAGAMAVDGLRSTRSVEFEVRSPDECRAMFDVLTYQKGAAVLRQLEQFLGAEDFRRGISLYLRKHQYANTETHDLWDALEESSHQPVRKIMDSWIFQPGFPIVDASLAPGGRGLKLSQRRFYYLPENNDQLWHVPVMVGARTESGIVTKKVLMNERETSLDLGGRIEWALLNDGGHGFYRTHYAPELLAALTRNLGELKPIERFGLVNDTWAATLAGLTPLAEFIGMIRLFTGETDINVWRAINGALGYLEMIASEGDRPALAALVRAIVGPAAARLGWVAKPGETELDRQLRGVLLGVLGTLGDDPAVQRRAAELYARFEDNPAEADRDLVAPIVSILAHCGDAKRYGEFQARFKSARTPQEEQRYLFSLAEFRDPAVLARTMAMTVDGQVRSQNAPFVMHSLLVNTACRYQAWDFVREKWDEMSKKYPDSALPRMCEGVIALLDREEEVKSFFAAHRVRLGAKIIDQHLERLSVAVAFRKREGGNLASLLRP